MHSVMEIGTEVIILDDTRSGKPAMGKIGKVVGFLDHVKVGIYFREDGTVIDNQQELLEVQEQMDGCCGEEPKGIVVYWDPDTQEFPKKKCYLTFPHLIYELDDGTRVDSTRIYAVPLNPLVIEKMFKEMEALLKKTGCPEKELSEFWRSIGSFWMLVETCFLSIIDNELEYSK